MSNFIPFPDARPHESMLRRAVPAWISSLVFHTLLVLLLAITIKVVPRGAAEEPSRTTGIVLKHVTDAGEYYEGEEENIEAASESVATDNPTALAAALPSANEAPSDPSELLPDASEGLGPPAAELGGGGNIDLSGDAPGTREIRGGKARTGVFGLTGEGYKFVYVFDSSASMSEPQGRPLAAAKHELAASLQSLGRLHQFQIIFYNEFRVVFNPTGVPGRLFFATDDNKKSAAKFINGVQARLSTDHDPALAMAVGMRPDVIFFLTDGEEPRLSPLQLEKIGRLNGGHAAIHVIQFGTSPAGLNSWLRKLARQNAGQYQFVPVSRFSPRG